MKLLNSSLIVLCATLAGYSPTDDQTSQLGPLVPWPERDGNYPPEKWQFVEGD